MMKGGHTHAVHSKCMYFNADQVNCALLRGECDSVIGKGRVM